MLMVIAGVCSEKEINVFQVLAEALILREEEQAFFASSKGEIFSGKVRDAPIEKAKGGVGVALLGEGVSYHVQGGSVSVVNGEVYGGRLGGGESGFERFLVDNAGRLGDLEEGLKSLEGNFASLILRESELIAVRDRFGCKALYWGTRNDMTVFTGRLRGGERLGLKVKPAPAGSILRVSQGRVSIKGVYPPLPRNYDEKISLDKAVNELSKLIRNAVSRRCKGRLGVLFSGGLDSTIIVKVLDELGLKPRLYCSGVESGKDVENAASTADEMGLELKVETFSAEDVEKVLPEIVSLVGCNVLDVELSIPLFFALKAARRDGVPYALLGTGADEGFGGYARYITVLEERGYDALHNVLVDALEGLAEKDLIREEEVASSLGVFLRRPFLDGDVIDYAVRVPPQLKISNVRGKYVRKLVLRKIARCFSAPKSVVERDKLAMQYGSGVDKLLRRIASERGFTKRQARDLGFKGPLEHFLRTLKPV
ncbi:MAG: asparagine synthase family protein [Candidatus Freyarchaeota archaeon]